MQIVPLLFCCITTALAGCGATVVPPAPPADPTTIYLCDYGVHSSLLLPVNERGRYVEYLYGDYNWAALEHTQWYDAVGAALFSQQATLGRRFLTAPAPGASPEPYPPPKTQASLIVSAQACQAVVHQFDSRWQSHLSTATAPTETDGYFCYVKDDRHYSIFHDCNHQTADTLRQLGCTVHGCSTLSDFAIAKNR